VGVEGLILFILLEEYNVVKCAQYFDWNNNWLNKLATYWCIIGTYQAPKHPLHLN